MAEAPELGGPTIFGKIIRREIPAEILFEDELCLAFKDINPTAPVHVLVIPKEPVVNLSDATEKHEALLGHLLLVAHKIAEAQGVGDGYRVITNSGEKAGQSVFHLHFHVIGGRPLSWPAG